MTLSGKTEDARNEKDVFEHLLSLNGKEILELGCGKAQMTRLIATAGQDRKITATEVDKIQHNKNMLIDDLPNVTFVYAGSEAIPFDDDTFDIIFMFKSLHHVPIELMGKALNETKRVLKPGGMAYISEPVFAGDFNEVLRLFHDEQKVREAAHRAIKKAIADGLFSADEISFNTQITFKNFEEFECNVINVTHSDHKLSPEIYQQVKKQFSYSLQEDGAKFLLPLRVDLLQKKL